MRILVVEDQDSLRQILNQRLSHEGYAIDEAADGKIAYQLIEMTHYDAIILDIMIPKINGLELLKRMRANHNDTPVLLLTARDTLEDRVKGLDTGADDYLIKPFAFSELLARIRALLRRRESTVVSQLSISDLTLDRELKVVTRAGIKISLSKKEYSILEYLMLNQGKVVSRTALEENSTNYDYEGYSNVIDVYIRFLRKKIDDGQKVKLIHTVRGFGYIMRVDE